MKPKKLIKELEKQLRKDSDNLVVRLRLAAAYREVGRVAEAVELYRSVAIAYHSSGRLVQAAAVCRSVLELEPGQFETMQLLARLEGVRRSREAADAQSEVELETAEHEKYVPSLAPRLARPDARKPVTPRGKYGPPPAARPDVSEAAGSRPSSRYSRPLLTPTPLPAPLSPHDADLESSVVEDAIKRYPLPIDLSPSGPLPEVSLPSDLSPVEDDIFETRPTSETVDEDVQTSVRHPMLPESGATAASPYPGDKGLDDHARMRAASAASADDDDLDSSRSTTPLPRVVDASSDVDDVADTGRIPRGRRRSHADPVDRPTTPAAPAFVAVGSPGRADDVIDSTEEEVPPGAFARHPGSQGDDDEDTELARPAQRTSDTITDEAEPYPAPGVGTRESDSRTSPRGLDQRRSTADRSSGNPGRETHQQGFGSMGAGPGAWNDEPTTKHSPYEHGPLSRADTPRESASLVHHAGAEIPAADPSSLPSPAEISDRLDEIDMTSAAGKAARGVTDEGSETNVDLAALPRRPDGLPQVIHDDMELGEAFHVALLGDDSTVSLGEVQAPLSIFSSLPPEAVSDLAERMDIRHFDAGHYVVREGEPSAACYIIISGEVVVLKRDPFGDGAEPIEVTRLADGALFGEFALLANHRRQASVRAAGDCHVYEIPRRLLRELAASYGEVGPLLERIYRERMLSSLMNTAPFLRNLPEARLQELFRRFDTVRYDSGQHIVREGSRGGGMYLLLLGSVEITRRVSDKRSALLATLYEGGYFAEMALARGGYANVTVTAAAPSELAVLSPEDFYGIIENNPELWDRIREQQRRPLLEENELLTGETYVT